ncbi:MAG: Ger(x)C family spore germination protein [Bacillota bacterium]
MRHRRAALLLVMLITLPGLAGCWNKIEVEEAAYVLAIGVDRGEQMPYSITVTIAKPANIAGKEGGGKEEKPTALTTVEAPSLTGALTMLNSYIGRQVNLHHARALFVHEALAREEGMVLLDEVTRFRQTRQTIFLIVTRERAAEFLAQMKPELDKNPMRYIEQLTYQYRRSAMLPAESQVNAFVSRVDVAFAQPITYYAALAVGEEKKEETASASAQAEAGFRAGELPRTGGTNVEMIGAAAFRRQRMVGVLTGDEVRHLLMLNDQFREALCVFKDPREPNRYISVQLSRSRPFWLNADLSGERPRIYGRISLEAQMVGVQSGAAYDEPELQGLLNEAIERQVHESIERLIAKTQTWEADVVGFGRHLIAQFPTVQAWEAYNWPERYPQAEFDIEVVVKLRRFGLILSPVDPR